MTIKLLLTTQVIVEPDKKMCVTSVLVEAKNMTEARQMEKAFLGGGYSLHGRTEREVIFLNPTKEKRAVTRKS